MKKHYEVIIIGSGIAGMTAAIYLKRGGVSPLIIEESAPGGQLNKVNVIENYPGFEKTDGPSLAFNIYNQVRKLDIEYLFDKVTKTDFTNNIKVYTSKLELTCDYLIIATGKISKKLFSDDDRYIGSGISYCALCDSHLYKDKDVVVTGNNDLAFSEAIYLSDIASSVTLITNNKYNDKRIKIINSSVKEFIGQDALTGVKLENDDVIKCSAAFIYNGYITEVNFLNELGIINDSGNIDVDSRMETNVKGIYAAGDIIKKDVYQINTAVSEGCIAALSAKMDIINEK